ncbi:MAG: hypothetical protein ACT4PO_15720 [Actinomycetota bacterium]
MGCAVIAARNVPTLFSFIAARDVVAALATGRRCLVFSQWKEHVERLAQCLREAGKEPFVLEGGLGKKARTAILEAVGRARPEDAFVTPCDLVVHS